MKSPSVQVQENPNRTRSLEPTLQLNQKSWFAISEAHSAFPKSNSHISTLRPCSKREASHKDTTFSSSIESGTMYR